MQKRLPALLLAALMVWTLAVPAMGFPDVPEDHWAFGAVSYLVEAGLIEGYPDGTFGGSRTMTRFEAAMALARLVNRLERRIDQLVAQGIEIGYEDLVKQVSAALNEANRALAAAEEAKFSADEALNVALGILDAIDAGMLETTSAAPSTGPIESRAEAALHAAEQAKQVAEEAMDIAVGILDAIDARGWDESINEAVSETRALAEQVAASQQAAKDAHDLAQQAIDIALGTLDAIDARGWDQDIDALYAQVDDAVNQARAAIEAARRANDAAQEALEAAVATLDAIDSRQWDARIADAQATADRALALAQRLAQDIEEGAPSDVSLFTPEARAAIEEIAARVVADRVRAIEENAAAVADEVKGLRADLDAADALIKAEAARLEKAIADATAQLRRELEVVGVRVDDLEAKFMALEATVASHGEQIEAIRAELDRVKVSGSNEVRWYEGYHRGDTPYENPRDPEDEFEVPKSRAENRLHLRIDSKFRDTISLVSELNIVADHTILSTGSLKPVIEKSQAYVEATTDQAVRVIRIGSLDKNRVAAGFLPELVDAEEFGTDNFGFFVNIASGASNTDVFGAKAAKSGVISYGANVSMPLGDNMDLSIGALHHRNAGDPRNAVGIASSGRFSGVQYEGYWAKDVEEDSLAYSGKIVLPIDEKITFSAHFDRLDEVWSESRRLPFAAEAELREPDVYLDRPSAVNEKIFAGERVVRYRVEMPLAGGTAFLQMGQSDFLANHEDPVTGDIIGTAVQDRFSQYGVKDMNLLGFDVEATRSRFVDWFNEDAVMTDSRVNLSTQVELIDLDIAIHSQENKQLPDTDPEYEQRHFLVSLSRPVQIFLPWKGTLAFGTSFTADNKAHSAYKLELEGYEAAPGVTVNAEISGQNNRIDDGEWRLNEKWSGHKETVQAVDATWRFAEPMNLFGGYKVVNNEKGRTTTQDAGLEYKISALGGDLSFGYGYRVVHRNGAVDGEPRNVFSAAYTRTAGDFTLSADAKYYIGGTEEEDGNKYDTIANLRLVYPVFSGADFSLTGKYVHSRGEKVVGGEDRPEYMATSVVAGFKIHF